MEHSPPPFFNRGPAPLVRLAFFASLSLALLVLDARFRYTEGLRSVLALAVYPLQSLAMLPVALGYIVVVTTTLYLLQHVAGITSERGILLGLGAVSLVLVLVLTVIVDRGILLKGSGPRRADRPRVAGNLRPVSVRVEG